jgi:tetratricopeptide (TPR) repeat protein
MAIKAPTLYRARAQVSETLGEFERARSDYEATLALAREAGDGQAEWQTLLDLGLLWAARDYGRSRELYETSLALAREMTDQVAIAHSLNRLGNWHMNIDEPLAALRFHEEALSIFLELEESRGLSQTFDLLAMTSCMSGDLVKGTAYYQQAIGLFQQMDDRRGLVSSLATSSQEGHLIRQSCREHDRLCQRGRNGRAARTRSGGEPPNRTRCGTWRRAMATGRLPSCVFPRSPLWPSRKEHRQ